MHRRVDELKQEAKRIAVTPERLGTDVSMGHQMLKEEFLKQWPDKGIGILHDWPPTPQNAANRFETMPSSSGVDETYQ